MRLLSLNVWGATRGSLLFDYLSAQAKRVDFFCFQEVLNAPASVAVSESHGVRIHLFAELAALLPEFEGFFAQSRVGYDFDGPVDFALAEGLAIFARKTFRATDHGYTPIASQQIKSGPWTSVLQRLTVSAPGGQEFDLFNFHGIALPGDKLDTPERLAQSEKIKEIIRTAPGAKILCGDFNLELATNSIGVFEPGLRNLIKEFNVTNTRNQISWDMYHSKQYFADYTFVSPKIRVKSFEVPYNEVSDHLPMALEFEI